MSDALDNTVPDQGSDRTRGVTVIYFLGTQCEQFIKIGRTNRKISLRMAEHGGRGPNKQKYVFLAAVPGLNSDETGVHNAFRPQSMDDEREWFHTSPDLEGYIRWLRQQWFTLRTKQEADDSICRTYDGISGALWLPAPDRVAAAPATAMTFDSLSVWGHVLDGEPPITGDDFYTDGRIIAAARQAMGNIDLDPATHPIANRLFIRAPRIYTLETNGLVHPWSGNVWCNPPFGQWQEWGPKIASEWASGSVEAMCALMATRSVTAQANSGIWDMSAAVCFTRGRIPFWGPKAGSPDDGHAIFYFGRQPQRFAQAFQPIGYVMTPWRHEQWKEGTAA